MFGPPIGLLIRIGAAIAVTIALVVAWHLFTNHYREQGRVEIQAKWDAEKEAQAKELMRRTENAERARQESARAAVVAERARVARFAKLDAAKAAAANPIRLTADDVRLFNDARSAAEASRSPGEPVQAAPAPSDSTQAYVVDLQRWAAECIDRVGQWTKFYRDQQAAWSSQ